jgi:hypothetical protein
VEAGHAEDVLMDRFLPRWQFYREALNRLPVRGETWSY